MKRGRSDSLTGGSRDVNPQFLSFTVTQSAGDTTTTKSINTPIFPLSNTGKSKGQALEILKVFFYYDLFPSTATGVQEIDIVLSTKNFGTTIPTEEEADSLVFASAHIKYTFTTSGASSTIYPVVMDLTDGAGHGLLIVAQNIYATLFSAGSSQANQARVKILYRVKEVQTTELLGILASQFQA